MIRLKKEIELTIDLSGIDQAIQKTEESTIAVRGNVNQINTQLRYNWVQWQQFSTMVLSQFKQFGVIRAAMAVIDVANMIDMQRRLKLEIAAQLEVKNYIGAAALLGISIATIGLRIKAEMNKKQAEMMNQKIQTISNFQAMM